MKNVLNLPATRARKFFLKESNYFSLELPPYFTFGNLLRTLSNKIKKGDVSSYYAVDGQKKIIKPEQFENVNYKLLSNKDGQYAWRPFQLIHPVLYVALVQAITEEKNWTLIHDRFELFSKQGPISCVSLPIVSVGKQTDKAEQISAWRQEVEQKSIELALEYEYMYHIDIADCYGAIYTHSIAWALHDKDVAKKGRFDNSLLGNQIDKSLQAMSFGQTNGIPQGSVLMDFIAEIVLGYSDLLLAKKITKLEGFQIIRYRDDYRIFTNNPQTAEVIIKNLTDVLADLGLKINGGKTVKSNNIIRDAIKPDKFYWEINNKMSLAQTPQNQLYIISDIANKFPNTGTINKQLEKFHRTINVKKIKKKNINALISIVADIAFKNPKTYPYTTAIISKFLNCLTTSERFTLIKKLQAKFEKTPNTGHLQIWLQRVTITIDKSIKYEEKLCHKVANQKTELWCSEWLDASIKNIINATSIIDYNQIPRLGPIIESKEIALFNTPY